MLLFEGKWMITTLIKDESYSAICVHPEWQERLEKEEEGQSTSVILMSEDGLPPLFVNGTTNGLVQT